MYTYLDYGNTAKELLFLLLVHGATNYIDCVVGPWPKYAIKTSWMTIATFKYSNRGTIPPATHLMVDLRRPIVIGTGEPVSSLAGSMMNTDRIVAIAIQTVSRAMFLPAQDLKFG